MTAVGFETGFSRLRVRPSNQYAFAPHNTHASKLQQEDSNPGSLDRESDVLITTVSIKSFHNPWSVHVTRHVVLCIATSRVYNYSGSLLGNIFP